MPTFANPGGIDYGSPNLDVLGALYMTGASLYLLFVVFGLWLLFRNRKSEEVKLRGIALTFMAVLSLQVYLVLVFLVYPENGLFSCSTEFWVMSIALPLGIAMFQAANIRLLSYHLRQHRLIYGPHYGLRRVRYNLLTVRGFLGRWAELDIGPKTYIYITLGLLCTIVTTIMLFFGSRMFHGFGFFGVLVGPAACRRGYEWIPSIFWQLLWSVVIGPYCLWRGRRINDVHRWAIQTRIAIVASISGTPMWLAFTYLRTPQVLAINKHFPPAMWFMPCIVTLQQSLIWFPIYDHYHPKANSDETEYYYIDKDTGDWLPSPRFASSTTLGSKSYSNLSIKSRNRSKSLAASSSGGSIHTALPTTQSPQKSATKEKVQELFGNMAIASKTAQIKDLFKNLAIKLTPDQKTSNDEEKQCDTVAPTTNSKSDAPNTDKLLQMEKKGLFGKSALEAQLKHDITPLLEFAASKDFTSENVIFLEEVSKFRTKWTHAERFLHMTQHMLLRRFAEAAQIFFVLINSGTSEFNINIDARIYKQVARMFEGLTWVPYEDKSGSANVITPWDNYEKRQPHSARPMTNIGRVLPPRHHDFGKFGFENRLSDRVKQTSTQLPPMVIPAGFDHQIFNDAYASVFDMVLHNTWSKYVTANLQTGAGHIVLTQLACADAAKRRSSDAQSKEDTESKDEKEDISFEDILRSGSVGSA